MADPRDRDDGDAGAPPVTIERPDPGEIDALVELWVDLASGQRSYDSHIEPESNRGAVRDTLARHAVAGGLRAARCDGEVVGFVSFALERGAYESDETRGIVHNVYVVPAHRGRGIGGDLLAVAESELAAAGASVVALEAMADNDRARRFYRRRGYEPHRVELEKRVGADPEPEPESEAQAEAETGSSVENDTHSKED